MIDNLFITFGIIFIFLMTTLGSSLVFFKKTVKQSIFNDMMLAFAGGIMLGASIFSLIVPSFEYSIELGINEAIPASVGIIAGVLFILIFDIIISKQQQNNLEFRNKKMFVAVTLHNIPEGLAVGLTFGLALNNLGDNSIISALVFAIGIGLQNFPEGAVLAIPLEESFKSKTKAFFWSMLSGAIEPVFACIGLLLSTMISNLMPWVLCFGAGAMIYVVIDELIICSSNAKEKRMINLAFVLGFLVMMIMDLTL